MKIQRLRNLTTGRLHTEMDHIYKGLEMLTGEDGLMTHMLPRVMDAIEPWLRENVLDLRFWDGKYDTKHTGEINLEMPTKKDQEVFFKRFLAMPNPLDGKDVIIAEVSYAING